MKLRMPPALLWIMSTHLLLATAFQQPRLYPMRLSFVGRLSSSASSDTAAERKPTVTRLPDSAVEISIPVPGTATQAAYNKVCTELSKNIQIPGFRKGAKIPPAVLEQNMAAKGGRNALRVQAINELLKQLLEVTLKEQNLDPIGQASLVIPLEELAATFQPGQEITLPVRCDVWPEIQWKTVEGQTKPYVGLKGKYARKPFDQSKLDKALSDLRERYATLEPITDPSYTLQLGDACTVNMVGFMANEDGSKGSPLPNAASGDNVEVVLGSGRYMDGLVEGLLGGKVGQTKQVRVTFPEKLRDKSLAGKNAVFDVEIVQASKRVIPEVTDEFAAKVRAGLTAEAMIKELRKAVDADDAKEFTPSRNKALGEALAEVMDVDVPDTLITNQAREKFAVMMAEMRDNGVADDEIKRQITPENFQKWKDIVKDDIIRDFKVSMATDEIARLEGISVPDYQVEEQLQAIKKDAQEAEDFDENLVRAKVQTTLERQAVMDWLAEHSELEVEYKDEKFDEALLEQLAQETMEREKKLLENPMAPPHAEAMKETASTDSVKAPIPPAPVEEKEMTLQEKAFQALVSSGAIELNKPPDAPDYDHSKDNEYVS